MSAAPSSAAPALAFAPLEGGQRLLGTVAVSLATFMVVLDSSIANVSLPAIAGNLGVSPAQGTWVITSFGVANAISLPLTGWLTRRFGQVRLFISSLLLFVLASWLCGLAPNIESLIACRVLQGLVSGPMFPLSQTLLLASYPSSMAGSAMAVWGMTTLVAPVTGPLLGGWITDHIGWPWIFYINIPIGLLASAVAWSIYRARDPGPSRVRLDRVGLGLLVLWVGSLQIVIDKGKELDWFGSPMIVTLALLSLVSFAYFLVWELTDSQPIVDLRLFARRNFSVGTATLALGYGLFMGNVVLLPLWLQQWMGYTASWAGAAMAPVGLLAIVFSPWVGRNVARLDARGLAMLSFIGIGGVLWMRSQFNLQSTYSTIALTTLLQGAAMAFYFIPLQAIIISGLRPDQLPAAAGLSTFMRITAGALGTSIFTTLWDSRAAQHRARLVEAVQLGNPATDQALGHLEAVGLGSEQARATLSHMIDQQAFTLAADDLFRFSAALFVLLAVMVWWARPQPAVDPVKSLGSAAAADGPGGRVLPAQPVPPAAAA